MVALRGGLFLMIEVLLWLPPQADSAAAPVGFRVWGSLCFSTAVRCPPRPKSRVERLKAKLKPLLTSVEVDFGPGATLLTAKPQIFRAVPQISKRKLCWAPCTLAPMHTLTSLPKQADKLQI